MPMYDYRCHDCGHQWEVLLPSADTAPDACPQCGGGELQRLLPTANVARGERREPGKTCCGRDERCSTPSCSSGGCRPQV